MGFIKGLLRGRAETHAVLSAADGTRMMALLENFFRGGTKWTQGAYHRLDGTKCLVGAINHLRRHEALSHDQAEAWIKLAISEQSPGGPPPAGIVIESFNDSRSSYG